MSNITAKVIVDSANAQASLDKLNNKIKTTTDGFSKLNSLLGGIAIGAFVKSAFDLADAMADIAQATEMSIASVSGFSKAVAASGGSIEGAQKSLIKFTENIGGAAEGSAELQNAFYQVGVSLEDLKKLSSEDLLAKTIDGLTKVSDVSARLKLQSDLLGKGFKGVNAGGVAADFDNFKKASEASAQAQEKAAQAVDKFNASVTKMKEQVLVALEPVVSAFNKIPLDQLATATKLVVELGAALLLIKGGTKVWSLFADSVKFTSESFAKTASSFSNVNSAISNGKGGVITLSETWNRLGYQVRAVARDFKAGTLTMDVLSNKTIPILGTRLKYAGQGFAALGKSIALGIGSAVGGVTSLALGLGSLVLQILAVNEAISAITGFDFIDTWAKKLESFVKDTFPSLHKAIDDLGKKMGMADINGKPQGNVSSEKEVADKAKEQLETLRDVQNAYAKQKLELNKILKDYVDANDQATKRYNLETSMIGLSQEQQAMMSLRNEKEIEYLNQKKAIQEKIDQISQSGNPLEKASLLPDLNKQMQDLTAEYNKQTAAIEGQVKARMTADAQNQKQLFIDQQRVSLNQAIDSLLTESATVSLPEIDRQYANIKASAEAAAKAQIANEEARRGSKLNASEVEEYYRIALAGVEDLYQAQLKLNAAQNEDRINKFGLQAQIDSSNELLKIQDDIAKMTMPEIEQKYYDIAAAARDSAKAAIDAEEIRRGAKLDPSEAQRYYDKAYAGVSKLTAATKKQWEMSRSFETGWKKAMNSYISEASNAATKAEKLFTTACKGMEDAIVGFVKTGKFEWKSFVNDMLEQLLRSQIQGVFANLMQSITGSLSSASASLQSSGAADTGILDAIGSLFGGSSSSSFGGTQGSPVYVTNWPTGGVGELLGGGAAGGGGSAGGSIWDTISNTASDLWDTVTGWFGGGTASGTGAGSAAAGSLWGAPITSSSSSQSSGWFEDVASSVGDIASSIGDWFGGFFADGGRLPAGKIGIVGERGPEFIGGPANITPMSAGGSGSQVTNVYYTINATDPQSFQAQLARDPGFVHAVVTQGAKGMPA